MSDEYEKAAVNEYKISAAELHNSKSALAPLKRSYARYNNLIASAIDASSVKPACKAGCAYCCHYKVEVKAHELFLIHDYMQKNIAPPLVKKIVDDAKTNSSLIRTLTPQQHLTTNIKCPFLIDNQCSVYEVRPYKCRNFHATDFHGCEQSYFDTSLAVPSTLIENVAMFGDAHSQGFEAAAQKAGYDYRTYDLNTALVEVFNEPNAIKRFRQGKKSFPGAIEVTDI